MISRPPSPDSAASTVNAGSRARRPEGAYGGPSDAATAREAATELQDVVLRLHEELRSERTETQRLHETLRLAEERAEYAAAQVAELQHSRWRSIGLLLGLARRATFER